MKPFKRNLSIANSLRVVGFSWILGGVGFFFPWTWELLLSWFGMGKIQPSVFMSFILVVAGWLSVAIGLIVWIVATDILRYRPIVMAIIALHLIAAPVFYWIDSAIGMTTSWSIFDCACWLASGGFPLAFWLWPSQSSPNNLPESQFTEVNGS